MTHRRRLDRKVVWVLVAGFSLTIVTLLVSAFAGIQAIELVESRSVYLMEQHRMSTRLIDEIQGEEAGLSSIFYAVRMNPANVDRATLLNQLKNYEAAVSKTISAAQAGPGARQWSEVAGAAREFIAEVRELLQSPEPPVETPARLYRAHENLVTEMASLVSENYQAAVEEEAMLGRSARERMRHSLGLMAVALGLSVICAAATVIVALQMFQRTEWQARELSRLSGHVLDTQEQMLHRFSRELHDEFGQTLTAIKANLAAVPRDSPDVAPRIEDCVLLVQDAMANVREMSQLLRPSVLDDFGLVPSLQWLAESFSLRTGIKVEPHLDFNGRLPGETETHVFRIAQEALTNVARHSGATRVRMSLGQDRESVRLSVADNGGGIQAKTKKSGGFGLIGMRERMVAAGGRLEIQSSENGVTILAEIPLNGIPEAAANPGLVGG
jgi:signal transduction histidine kinase